MVLNKNEQTGLAVVTIDPAISHTVCGTHSFVNA